MRVGFWYRISGDRPDLGLPVTPRGTRYLRDNDPAADAVLNPPASLRERLRRLAGREWLAPWSGRMGFAAITEAWNSAVYASGFGQSGAMVVFGGGHNDYFGSDVHAFDLATRCWQRLSTGFISGAPEAYGEGAVYPDAVYPDGSPLPPHTYDYLQYDAIGNNVLLLKGQTELGPNVKAVAIPHLFNLDTLAWRHGPMHPAAVLNSGGFSAWDARRRFLWGHCGDDGGGNAFVAYCPDGRNADASVGSWREFHPNKLPGEANHNSMQLHPDADMMVCALHKRDTLAVIDPNDPAGNIVPVRSAGTKPKLREYAALEYSERLASLVYHSAADGSAVFAIDWSPQPFWRLVSHAAAFDPVADAAAECSHQVNRLHTFGRFRVAHFEDMDLAILVRHTDSPVYAMRLA